MRWSLSIVFSVGVLTLMSCATTNNIGDAKHQGGITRPELVPGFWRDHELAVTVRFTSPDEPELQVTLLQGGGRVRAEVVEPSDGSESQDLTDPRGKVLRLEDDTLSEIISAFGKLRARLEPSTTLYLHPQTVTIWATTVAGNSMILLTVPPEHETAVWGVADDSNREILDWSRRVKELALNAMQKKQ